MERDWAGFAEIYGGVEGARGKFEIACETLFQNVYPNKNVHVIRASPGDEGIDVLIGDISDSSIDVIQCKFFLKNFTYSQITQINKSYKRAIENTNYNLGIWYLAIPKMLDVDETKLWSNWKKRKIKEYGIDNEKIRLITGNELINLMKKEKLYNIIFKIEDSIKIDEIYKRVVVENEKIDNLSTLEVNDIEELLSIDNFFQNTKLIFDAEIKYDVSRLIFEMTKNNFIHGLATRCKISIGENKIRLIDNGKQFNPLEVKIESRFRAGLRFFKLFQNKYIDKCEIKYETRGETNFLDIIFNDNISTSQILNPCKFTVKGNPTRVSSWSKILKFDSNCEEITIDISTAWFNPSNVYDFLEYLQKVTIKKVPKIILKFSENDLSKIAFEGILIDEHFHEEFRGRIKIH